MRFDDFSFHEKLLAGIKEMGFVSPTPVQLETFHLVSEGRDVEAQSQTGTGKTAAFLIAGFQLMIADPRFQGRKMLVIAPTRELADQIEKEAQIIGKHIGFRIGSFYGGVGYAQQEKLLAQGVDVVIGTPGRLLDFSQSGKLSFQDVGILVIDEADRLFDMGFYPDLRQMLNGMSDPETRRTMLFSATLSSQVMNLAWEYLRNPGQIVIEPEQVTVEKITQELYHVGSEEKFGLLLSLLHREKAKTAIIFTNTKHIAIRVAQRLILNGYAAEYIMGNLPQLKRLKIIEDMKAGRLSYLVATDVAARGLHINGLDLVVNYDLPTAAENYVHRIGRTARAGKSGKAISLACEKYVYGLKSIEDYTGTKISVAWLSEGDLVEDKSKSVHNTLETEMNPKKRMKGRPHSLPTKRNVRDQIQIKRGSSLVSEAAGGKFLKNSEKTLPNKSSDKEDRRHSSQAKKLAMISAAKSQRGRETAHKTAKNNKNSYVPAMKTKKASSRLHVDLKDRLDYYRAKYGENFQPVGSKPLKTKPGFWEKLAHLLRIGRE